MELIYQYVNFNEIPFPIQNKDSQFIINSHRTFVVGDLHGNFKKLLAALIHLNFIQYRSKHMAEQNIFDVLLRLSTGPHLSIVAIETELNNFFQIPKFLNKIIFFVGDTICDRGPSDFITLSIFAWMKKNNIHFKSMLGNHETTLLRARPFHEDLDEETFQDLVGENSYTTYFRSFDYFRIRDDRIKSEFYELCKEYFLNSIKLFHIIPSALPKEAPPVLLSHAPMTTKIFDKVIEIYQIETGDGFVGQNPWNWTHLFSNPSTSYMTQYKFELWFKNKMRAYAEQSFLSENDKKFWAIIFPLTHCRDDVNPFFKMPNPSVVDDPVHIAGIARKPLDTYPDEYKGGVHVFGHMSGTYASSSEDHLTNSQICLDTLTGMPGYPSGQVRYLALHKS